MIFFRIIFLLGITVLKLVPSDQEEQPILQNSVLFNIPSFLIQCQEVKDRYGLCTLGYKNSTKEFAVCCPEYSERPLYLTSDKACELLLQTFVCCRLKWLVSCSSESLDKADVGCLVNCCGLDCSPASNNGFCEIYCPKEKKISFCKPYAARGQEEINNHCCFKSSLQEDLKIQSPFGLRAVFIEVEEMK